jgi:hypothetical protein
LLARLAAHAAELPAPRLLMEEVSNALLTGIRHGRWSGQAADRAHGLLRQLPVRLLDERAISSEHATWPPPRRASGQRHAPRGGRGAPTDAAHHRRRTQLITADASLRQLLVGYDWIIAPEEGLQP